jgi:hypothetical protein
VGAAPNRLAHPHRVSLQVSHAGRPQSRVKPGQHRPRQAGQHGPGG